MQLFAEETDIIGLLTAAEVGEGHLLLSSKFLEMVLFHPQFAVFDVESFLGSLLQASQIIDL